VGCQLGPREDSAVAGVAVVVRVPLGIGATRRIARLVPAHLAESRTPHVVLAKVQSSVGHHLVGVRADVVALATVEVRGLPRSRRTRLCGICGGIRGVYLLH